MKKLFIAFLTITAITCYLDLIKQNLALLIDPIEDAKRFKRIQAEAYNKKALETGLKSASNGFTAKTIFKKAHKFLNPMKGF